MSESTLHLTADVLVIGGGPAGCWAALAARRAGASVVLAEKGYVGTSGATPPANTTLFYTVPGDRLQNDGMVDHRVAPAKGFIVRDFVRRVYDETTVNTELMTRWGYPWPRNETGKTFRGNLRGPDYMIFLRKRLLAEGVRILDHSPALELLTADGVAAGAAGITRRTGDRWEVRAGAVVVATGGCAFRSGVVGTHNLTGDGYLLAAEAGARFSGMEFSGQWALAPAEGGLTKGIIYFSGSFSDADGTPIPHPGVPDALAAGRSVHAVLDRADPYLEDGYRKGQPNIFVYFHRLGGNPFTDRYPVRLLYEGTVRAAGGLDVDERCATSVPGLYAVGDATTREKLTGAAMSGGGPAVAWCIASGTWAGQAATAFARQVAAGTAGLAGRPVHAIGGAGLRPAANPDPERTAEAVTRAVQQEILPLDRNYRRTGAGIAAALERLDGLWEAARDGLAPPAGATPRDIVRAREAAALVATARWILASAGQRTETRGLHRRADFPGLDPAQHHHLLSGGLDRVWVRRADPHEEAVAA
ncbi:FAD-dependent oxidoreductase [Azospirillum brasilense]|uniref:Fumarate reductase/succinate dehydrogenase flavoprotein-like C-terminal domain-containing protein n=1 Tax=Azospirillum brasilense TaxID=192 RepID=A0A235HF28_AZOBR|nr:FAD-binding protein [Azospirillum brasilense]OYD84419.1 hypothetical protein CHT98_10190 [Azospirillum brasilense]